jgi:hypothetical protein
MKRALAVLVALLILSTVLLPGPATAAGSWHGHRGGHHGGWWWPGAVIGGLALGAVAIATAPFWAFTPPAVVAEPPVVYAPPAYAPAPVYYAAPAAPAPPPAPRYAAAPPSPAVQREVVFPNGRYVLYGDGVAQPWQWVWVPAPAAAAPPAR